ncbi:energy transducer TonB [Paraburkholderia megapolitana]|uniref:Protein TonB n=1 Tax=Paraburkholderia megapolitana TaxID=420953 RepID=A0A1I3MKF1_9BURK|nr:energy transducer TonB [Paraburkholderia megapolitana]SFI97401.1 protein TonB [Paraburkholderia megapolitana]
MRYRIVTALAALVVGACSSGPQSFKVDVYDTKPASPDQESQTVVRPLHPIAAGRRSCQMASPKYPKASFDAGERGVVKARIFLDPDGKFEKSEVVQSSGYPRLDEAAIESLKYTSCEPLMIDGKPVRASYVLPISFDINGR